MRHQVLRLSAPALRRLVYGGHATLNRTARRCLLALVVLSGALVSIYLAAPLFGVLIGVLCILGLLFWLVLEHTRLRGQVNDLHYEIALRDQLKHAGYVVPGLYCDGFAANPSFLLLLLKVLEAVAPRRILELGSGTTTVVLAQYRRRTGTCEVVTLEHDPAWASRVQERAGAPDPGQQIVVRPLEPVLVELPEIGLALRTAWYAGADALLREPFNLIVVDGPVGTKLFSRSGILPYLPGLLSSPFVLIFDDAERAGESTTIRALRRLLSARGVDYRAFEVRGSRAQYVLCSPSLAFLEFL